jgi:hypothetical protein
LKAKLISCATLLTAFISFAQITNTVIHTNYFPQLHQFVVENRVYELTNLPLFYTSSIDFRGQKSPTWIILARLNSVEYGLDDTKPITGKPLIAITNYPTDKSGYSDVSFRGKLIGSYDFDSTRKIPLYECATPYVVKVFTTNTVITAK